MKFKRLNNEEVLKICKVFIKGRGYACRLNIEEKIQNYLVENNYIYSQMEEYYILASRFYKDYKKVIDNLNLNKFEKELIKKLFCITHNLF